MAKTVYSLLASMNVPDLKSKVTDIASLRAHRKAGPETQKKADDIVGKEADKMMAELEASIKESVEGERTKRGEAETALAQERETRTKMETSLAAETEARTRTESLLEQERANGVTARADFERMLAEERASRQDNTSLFQRIIDGVSSLGGSRSPEPTAQPARSPQEWHIEPVRGADGKAARFVAKPVYKD